MDSNDTLKIALSIAGSDTSAGAGIQSDLKTFLSLGVYGCTALTAITAQNTLRISCIEEIDPAIVQAQIRAVLSDLPVRAIKIGMVYSKGAIDAIADMVSRLRIPIVIDPVLKAGTGATLLREDAVKSLLDRLIPISTLVTPNIAEAEFLSGKKILTLRDATDAARNISNKGAKNVIVKGGHLKGKTSTDVLVESTGRIITIKNSRIEIGETHGSGCNFSAAVTAFLARGFSVHHSCLMAGQYVREALRGAASLGKGHPISMPRSFTDNNAERYLVLENLQSAVEAIIKIRKFYLLIPETQSNFAYALPAAESLEDVAAVSGRIIRAGKVAMQASHVRFGVSNHVASAILARMAFNPTVRSAINIKYDARLLDIAKSKFIVASYDRKMESPEFVHEEGASIPWGMKKVFSSTPDAEIVYHTGAHGKEPMTVVFGREPSELVRKIQSLLNRS